MFSDRLLDILVVVALLMVIGLTVQKATATEAAVFRTHSVETACKSWPSRYSIHTEYIEEMGTWMTYTEDGPLAWMAG